MREKLIDLILGWGGLSNCAEEMADYFIENGVTIATDNNVGSKWIPVTDRLPSGWYAVDDEYGCYEPEQYLVFVKGAEAPTVGCYLDGRFQTICESQCPHGTYIGFTDEVTHWMPLPPPPKEE